MRPVKVPSEPRGSVVTAFPCSSSLCRAVRGPTSIMALRFASTRDSSVSLDRVVRKAGRPLDVELAEDGAALEHLGHSGGGVQDMAFIDSPETDEPLGKG